MTGVVVGTIVWLISGGVILLNWTKLPPEIPFLYSLPAGEQQLIDKPWLFVVWGVFGLLMWIDAIVAATLVKEESLLQKYLIWGGTIAQLLLFLTIWRIIQVVV